MCLWDDEKNTSTPPENLTLAGKKKTLFLFWGGGVMLVLLRFFCWCHIFCTWFFGSVEKTVFVFDLLICLRQFGSDAHHLFLWAD